MQEYPKIQSVFTRATDGPARGRFVEGDWRCPEFHYLRNCRWVWKEKVDGTNIRIGWDGETVRLAGRSDKAQLYGPLVARLQELFPAEKLATVFPPEDGAATDVCLYGEGHGAKIQKGGGNYIPDGVDFILFDVLVGGWWLKDDGIFDVAHGLGISIVPAAGEGSLGEAIEYTKGGIESDWGKFPAEGVVCRPEVPLLMRNGDRVITKIKTKDFYQEAPMPEEPHGKA